MTNLCEAITLRVYPKCLPYHIQLLAYPPCSASTYANYLAEGNDVALHRIKVVYIYSGIIYYDRRIIEFKLYFESEALRGAGVIEKLCKWANEFTI